MNNFVDMMAVDTLRRFMLERAQVRGEWVHLDTSWQEMLGRADYPLFVKQVLGEALTAAVLLSATIKHSGSLILQIRGEGQFIYWWYRLPHKVRCAALPNGVANPVTPP